MIICNSLLKHGYSNFSLIILEYCDSGDKKCIEREQYYLYPALSPLGRACAAKGQRRTKGGNGVLIKPEYNILRR